MTRRLALLGCLLLGHAMRRVTWGRNGVALLRVDECRRCGGMWGCSHERS